MFSWAKSLAWKHWQDHQDEGRLTILLYQRDCQKTQTCPQNQSGFQCYVVLVKRKRCMIRLLSTTTTTPTEKSPKAEAGQ